MLHKQPIIAVQLSYLPRPIPPEFISDFLLGLNSLFFTNELGSVFQTISSIQPLFRRFVHVQLVRCFGLLPVECLLHLQAISDLLLDLCSTGFLLCFNLIQLTLHLTFALLQILYLLLENRHLGNVRFLFGSFKLSSALANLILQGHPLSMLKLERNHPVDDLL